MIDLNQFDTVTKSNAGAEIQLKRIDGKLSDAFITVIGCDSEKFREMRLERRRAEVKRLESGAMKELSQREMDEIACDTLAKCTLGWRGIAKDGQELTFTEQAAFNLYLQYPAIREQIDAAIMEREHFVQA